MTMETLTTECDTRAQVHARLRASLESALSPIRALLDDELTIEIMLNADGRVWVERAKHGMTCTDIVMAPHKAERMLRHIAGALKRELNADHPILSCKLPIWGSRVEACIPPIIDAPIFAIRNPSRFIIPLEDYVTDGILSEEHARALRNAVSIRANILIGGGTGSGKTTFAKALLDLISRTNDRILIIEDTPELQCAAQNKLQFEVHPPAYTWRRAIMSAMRLRPDRVIVGEVRDGAALDLVKAWGTGHPGGLATVHANDTRAMLERLCQLIEEVVPRAPRELVAETINVCVHMQRDPNRPGKPLITGIDQVVGLDQDRRFCVEPLFTA